MIAESSKIFVEMSPEMMEYLKNEKSFDISPTPDQHIPPKVFVYMNMFIRL